MSDIRNRINLVALIAAVGAVIGLAGMAMAVVAYPKSINWSCAIVFVLAVIAAVMNILPRMGKEVASVNILLGVIGLIDSFFIYTKAVELIGGGTVRFEDINIGVWLAFAGAVIYIIFSVSDYFFKTKKQ